MYLRVFDPAGARPPAAQSGVRPPHSKGCAGSSYRVRWPGTAFVRRGLARRGLLGNSYCVSGAKLRSRGAITFRSRLGRSTFVLGYSIQRAPGRPLPIAASSRRTRKGAAGRVIECGGLAPLSQGEARLAVACSELPASFPVRSSGQEEALLHGLGWKDRHLSSGIRSSGRQDARCPKRRQAAALERTRLRFIDSFRPSQKSSAKLSESIGTP